MATVKPKGTCSTRIVFEIRDGIVTSCEFKDGCSGSLQAISKLVAGRKASEVIALLEGIQCRNGTSCPDQLARAIRAQLGRDE